MESDIRKRLKLLKKTIPFKWRVQSIMPKNSPKYAIMIPYVDARDVMGHLDTIIGIDQWSDEYYELKGRLFCKIGIEIEGLWIFKSDCGVESKTEKEKGEASDAFKRAAVKWGVNRDAYSVGTVKLNVKEYNGKYYPVDKDNKFFKDNALHDHCNSLAKIEELDNYSIELEKTKQLNDLFDE